MRVLIVDDEYKVCQLIKHLVHWEDYGMEIVGMVNDGELAFETICREKPDIVITDIRMPGMDGIELVEKTSRVLENVFFVIVSGYSQFEYARQAVKLGVEDYLVKPIRKKDLVAVLEKINGKHKKESDDRSEKETLKTELIQTRERIKNNLLQDLLFSQDKFFQTAPMEEIRETYGCAFTGSGFCMVLAHLYENSMKNDTDERVFVLSKIQKSLREKLEPVCTEFLCVSHQYEVICLLNLQEGREHDLNRQLVKVQTDISGIREIFPDARTAIVLGRMMSGLRECREDLTRMRMALLKRFLQERQFIFQEDSREMAAVPASGLISPELRKKLLLELELLHAEGVGTLVDEIRESLEEHISEPRYLYAAYREIIGIFLLGIQNYYKESDLPRMEDYLKGLDVFYAYPDVFAWLRQEMVGYVREQEQKQKDLESRPIRMAKKYINEHFRESVNLETVSREVGLNPAYFSSVFKKDTGQNFMDYVISVRMENAKALLTRTNKDVIDIAYEVGYSDVKYFSKLFKKNTSLTPTEYRKLYN